MRLLLFILLAISCQAQFNKQWYAPNVATLTDLVANGSFTSDTTSWAGNGVGTLASISGGVSGNCLSVLNVSGAAGAKQTLTTQAGKQYLLTLNFKRGTSTSGQVKVGSTDNGGELYTGPSWTDTDWSEKQILFTAASTTSYLLMLNVSGANYSNLWDEVTCTRITSIDIMPEIVLTNGMVAWWDFDESSGDAIDNIGGYIATNRNTCTFSAMLRNNGADLSAGSSRAFQASGDTAVVCNPAAITVSLWYYSDTTSGYIMANVTNSSAGNWYVQKVGATSLGVRIYMTSGSVTATPTITTSGQWIHCAFTWDDSEKILRVYLQGRGVYQSAVQANNKGNNPAWLMVGNTPDTFNGGRIKTDEFIIWNRKLSPDEINLIYRMSQFDRGTGGQFPDRWR